MAKYKTALDVKEALKLEVIYEVPPLRQPLKSGCDYGLSL